MESLLAGVVVGLVLYIAYLHLQLYISRRIISAFQQTTLAVDKSGRLGLKPALAAAGLLLLATLALSWLRG